ncbi:hypothetical protein HOLleu_30303 [Holothuria leucospilota]|uniref:Uncharacterized protein n=1 Tax=Holothuria leucospilota TaxID=206669 RepID=A0A9Q1BKA1_HOLLE|nr:hypothetical protein HOLleu_30303 [Holothuria leucospilota]
MPSENSHFILKGKLEVKMLIQLMKVFPAIEWTVVEPSAERINSYKEFVKEQNDALSGVIFDWRQITFQEFCKSNVDGSKKFHFVCAVHSLYFMTRQDLDNYMNTLFEWTEGRILMIHHTGNLNSLD